MPVLSAIWLKARFVEAEGDSVDDGIEIRRIGGSEDEDLGGVQIFFDGLFCGNT